ncbi:MAG: universal stress protein [Candidatus Rariloculaceae bacterium]
MIARHLQRLNILARSLQTSGLPISVDARWDYPLDEGISRKVSEIEPYLVIKDTHYHSAIRRSTISNTDWKLIQNCPAPLLLVKPREFAARPRVVAAIDPVHSDDPPGALDREILSCAREICAAMTGELHLFHAFDPSPAIAAAATAVVTPIAVPVRKVTEALEHKHREALDDLLSGVELGSYELHVHQGPPHQLLIALAIQLIADVVVMGAISRRSSRTRFVGGTAERVPDHLPSDLLIVKYD